MKAAGVIKNSGTDTFKNPRRGVIAISLAIIYLIISLAPLVSLTLHSKTVSHALTGQCTGDCNSCGCSPASRAARTCCCSKNRQQQALVHEVENKSKPDCCKKVPSKKQIVFAACGCPCDNSERAALSANGTSELLPFHFSARIITPHTDSSYFTITRILTPRYIDPPNPPPKIFSC